MPPPVERMLVTGALAGAGPATAHAFGPRSAGVALRARGPVIRGHPPAASPLDVYLRKLERLLGRRWEQLANASGKLSED